MPKLKGKAGSEKLKWKKKEIKEENKSIVSTVAEPFSHHGGLSILEGNIGRSVIKTSALKLEHTLIEAPAEVFDSQEALQAAYKNGELNKDFCCSG